MTRRQARLFAIIATAVCVVAFAGMTIDSHRQFPRLTNAQNLTPEVIAGKNVWHKYNCTNCHTLLGEGAYYAPDLTKIATQRGRGYLTAFMKDPGAFYDEQKYRRVMPRQDLTEQEIDNLISFLDWIARIDTQGWPPRPILVSGASIPGTDLAPPTQGQQDATAPAAGEQRAADRPGQSAPSADPVAQGQALFRAPTPGCFACHSTAAGVNLAGPTLAGMGTVAAQRLKDGGYKGGAKDVAAYIRESIVDPHAYLVPGPTYSAGGRSFMPDHYGKALTPEQIDHLVAYLSTLQ